MIQLAPLCHSRASIAYSQNYSLQFHQRKVWRKYEKKSVNNFIFVVCPGVGFL